MDTANTPLLRSENSGGVSGASGTQQKAGDTESLTAKAASGSEDENNMDRHEELLEGEEGLPCLAPGSVGSSAYLLAAMSLGVGVFVQPQVFASVGWATGVILLVFFAVVSFIAQVLLVTVIQSLPGKVPSYSAVASAVLGWPGVVVCSVSVMLACLIANAAHMQTVAQMLHDITAWYFTGTYAYCFNGQGASMSFPRSKRAVVIALLLALVFPLCTAKDITAVRHASTLSVGTCVVLAISVIALSVQHLVLEGGPLRGVNAVPAFRQESGLLPIVSGSGVLCFAYSSVIALPSVLHTMNVSLDTTPQHSEKGTPLSAVASDVSVRPNHKRQLARNGFWSVLIATIMIMILYVGTSLSSALAWGMACSRGNGNVIYLIPPENIWLTSWCFVLIISLTLLYAIINFPIVNSVESLLMLAARQTPGTPECQRWMASTNRLAGPRGWLFRQRRSIISFFAALIVLGLDCLSPHSVVPLFGLAGSLGVGSCCIVLPGVLYLARFQCGKHRCRSAVAVLVVLVGLAVTLGSSAATLYNVFDEAPSNSSAPFNCTIELHF